MFNWILNAPLSGTFAQILEPFAVAFKAAYFRRIADQKLGSFNAKKLLFKYQFSRFLFFI